MATVPRLQSVLSGRYDFLPSHVLRLIVFASRLRGCLPGFVSAYGALPSPYRPGDGPGSGFFMLAIPFPASLPTGKSRILHGTSDNPLIYGS